MALNASLNETLNVTSTGFISGLGEMASAFGSFIPLVFTRLWDLVVSPFRHSEMMWIIFPLLVTLLVLEFYFDRHGNEELGWAASVANSLILFIVAIDLIKLSFDHATPWTVFKAIFLATFTDATLPVQPQILILILFLGLLGVAITVVNYYHILPKKIAFEVSGHPPINFLAYFCIVIVYSSFTEHPVPLDSATLVAGVLLYVIILLIVFFIKRFVRRKIHGSGGRTWLSS